MEGGGDGWRRRWREEEIEGGRDGGRKRWREEKVSDCSARRNVRLIHHNRDKFQKSSSERKHTAENTHLCSHTHTHTHDFSMITQNCKK